MVKRAPVNVRYLWLFGEHILTRSFTARDPKPKLRGRARTGSAAVFDATTAFCQMGRLLRLPLHDPSPDLGRRRPR